MIPGSVDCSVPVDKDRHDLRIFRAIRKIIRSVDQHSKWLSAEYGITIPQLLSLMELVESGPMTLKEISEAIFIGSSTLVGIVDRLEARGLVKRERSDKDRRKVMIAPTEQGHELIQRSPSPLQDNLRIALNQLPELERTTIALSLERIVELLEIKQISAAPVLEVMTDLVDDKQTTCDSDLYQTIIKQKNQP